MLVAVSSTRSLMRERPLWFELAASIVCLLGNRRVVTEFRESS